MSGSKAFVDKENTLKTKTHLKSKSALINPFVVEHGSSSPLLIKTPQINKQFDHSKHKFDLKIIQKFIEKDIERKLKPK